MNEYIKSDLMRYYGKTGLRYLLKGLLSNRSFRLQCIIRLCNCDKRIVRIFGGFLYRFNITKRTIQIPKNTKIGYGLYIGHHGPVIVNPTAIIGDNCNLSQFTTIGSNKGKAATIGNNVYVGPNVCIVEDVVIGDNVTIGAGSVVTKNIPDNATAVGNYARVINYNNPGRFIKNKYIR